MGYLNRRLSAAMWSRALLMWGVMALAALLVGVIALWMGLFIRDNVRDELSAQQINFPQEEQLSGQERAIDGIVEYAGEQLDDGNKARVYSEYILLHMNDAAVEAGYPGATYATLGADQRNLRAEVQQVRDAGDQAALEDAEARLATVNGLRNTMLTGSNLRGNLLSAYGWWNVGNGVIYMGIAILVLALIFALLFFFEWKRGHLPDPESGRLDEPEPVVVARE